MLAILIIAWVHIVYEYIFMDTYKDIHHTIMSCVFLEQILFCQVYFVETVQRAEIKTILFLVG